MKKNKYFQRIVAVTICSALVLATVIIAFTYPPRSFPAGSLFTIEEGATLSEIADSLKSQGYIRSKTAFKIIVSGVFLGGNEAVAGDYVFENSVTAFTLGHRIIVGDFHLDPIKVTIQEGLSKFEIAKILGKNIPNFNVEKFIQIAPEGYLFPDTYFFLPNTKPEKVVDIMKDNFDRQLKPYTREIADFGKTLDDVVTMASIVETEARQLETRKIVAGILWKRIEEKMPLQVDVSFKYINGKVTHELTLDDLEIDSPYNTYRRAGLPPTPIANPGLDAIVATLEPIETKYYFFLSDENGVMHYAETFEQHKKNKELYLY